MLTVFAIAGLLATCSGVLETEYAECSTLLEFYGCPSFIIFFAGETGGSVVRTESLNSFFLCDGEYEFDILYDSTLGFGACNVDVLINNEAAMSTSVSSVESKRLIVQVNFPESTIDSRIRVVDSDYDRFVPGERLRNSNVESFTLYILFGLAIAVPLFVVAVGTFVQSKRVQSLSLETTPSGKEYGSIREIV